MASFAPQLRRRLGKGDSAEKTAGWFIKRMAHEKLHLAAFTPAERRFWKNIIDGQVQSALIARR
jgi:hypothetical protein